MVYQPMLEFLANLRANCFKPYIVSGGWIEFMRPWGEGVYGISPDQVVSSGIKTKFELRDSKLVPIRLPEIDFIDHTDVLPSTHALGCRIARWRRVGRTRLGYGVLVQRMAPAESGKAGVVPVSGDPFAPGLDGQCCQIGVGHQVAPHLRLAAQPRENLPVAVAGMHHDTVRAIADIRDERQGRLEGSWLLEHAWVGHNSDKAAEDEVGHAIGHV